MARIMIRCPSTGQPVYTGIDANRQSFESSSFRNNITSCPHCKQKHTWSKEDAYLEGG
jgi:endogenous inhibitor of DNA gyrase (YacG/DUF329 family)